MIEVDSLIGRVKETQTLSGGVAVYANAIVSLERFHASDVQPTVLYVLMDKIRRLLRMAGELGRQNINIFDLDGIYETSEGIVAPPVVETSDGVNAIVDGIHRFWIAKREGMEVRTVYVQDPEPSLPLVGLPVSWSEVIPYEVKPEDPKLLKQLRPGIADNSATLRKHYRDFGYLGSTGRRPRQGQNG